MNTFFTGPDVPRQNSLEELEREMRSSIKTNKEKEAKFNELKVFTLNLYDGYMNNLNVMVDISGIMLQYSEFIEIIMKYLDELKSTSFEIKPEQLSFLQNKASQYMEKIRKFFDQDHSKLVKTFKRNNIDPRDLEKVQENYNRQYSAIQDLRLKGGVASRRKSKRHIKTI